MGNGGSEAIRSEIVVALQRLPEMHREIITMLFGLEGRAISRKRLALRMGMPLEELDHLRDEALRMLRTPPSSDARTASPPIRFSPFER